ncbi:unnamed protein product [Lepeophtheirus salmonis]|uniref:(salmon louse) hypothetical protein n=1 Tax=Lepeophtheirus salmonis TaxID=72036 RepID=A0A7R8HCB2_LEPSM|nr:unnamed protein product [Lepeophtheirus salmonis]CAF2998687.1 unnamed protein product [Lepeophtheirus salmonis]
MLQPRDRKDEIDALRGDHEQLRKDHDAFVVSAERENDLRKNEVKSLEERQQKDNQARIVDISKLEGKLDTENSARKSEIQDLDKWAKGENDARKTEIANLDNFAKSENDARKAEIADLNNFAKTENDGRISDIAALNSRMDSENKQRSEEDKNLNERSLAGKPLSVYFDAYRTKAYDGGGEENLTFNGVSCNVGGGLDPESGVFIAPIGGAYIFIFHVATHDNKKALLSIRHNGEEVASIFDQNHKDNHKNSMAGTTILLSLKKGDEVVVYAYTGTWLADFPMNHYTHWVGLLLKPSEEAIQEFRDSAEEGNFEEVPAN